MGLMNNVSLVIILGLYIINNYYYYLVWNAYSMELKIAQIVITTFEDSVMALHLDTASVKKNTMMI